MKSLTFKKNSRKEEKKVLEKTYVTMSIGGNLFGIDVDCVNTVYGMTDIREIPGLIDYMKGVITIRERIIPVIDLRIKLQIADVSDIKNTVVIITDIKDELVGMIVDSVHDVVSISEKSIQQIPSINDSIDNRYIEGIVKSDDNTIVIIDPGGVISEEELSLCENSHADIA